MQTVNLAGWFLGADNDVHCATGKVDCRCAADADVVEECAAILAGSNFSRTGDVDARGGIDEALFPQRRGVGAEIGIGIKS
jgi:hypothetical protein